MKYIIDVYVKRKKWWMKKYDFSERNTETSTYYTIKVEKKDRKKIIRKLNWRKIKYKCYEEKWGRNTDCRRKFLKENKGPFRCRYCNKSIKEDNMVIDHVIPIAKAKKNQNHARFLLQIRGITEVNDLRNLVPSCRKCNDAKRDKMGIWLVKAWLGQYELYWTIKPLITIALICFVTYYMYINEVFDIIYKFICSIS